MEIRLGDGNSANDAANYADFKTIVNGLGLSYSVFTTGGYIIQAVLGGQLLVTLHLNSLPASVSTDFPYATALNCAQAPRAVVVTNP